MGGKGGKVGKVGKVNGGGPQYLITAYLSPVSRLSPDDFQDFDVLIQVDRIDTELT